MLNMEEVQKDNSLERINNKEFSRCSNRKEGDKDLSEIEELWVNAISIQIGEQR